MIPLDPTSKVRAKLAEEYEHLHEVAQRCSANHFESIARRIHLLTRKLKNYGANTKNTSKEDRF